jgi:hypothetical protein
MSQESLAHHSVKDRCGAVSQQMGTVDQHDGSTSFPSSPNSRRAIIDQLLILLAARFGRGVRIDHNVIGPSQTHTF